jgi:hypothetical protein
MTNEQAKRITKVVAWLLVALMIVALVSGWGITRTEIIYQASRGLIDRGNSQCNSPGCSDTDCRHSPDTHSHKREVQPPTGTLA